HAGTLRRRRTMRTVPWFEAAELFEATELAREVAAMRTMHPSDIARQVSTMPDEHRQAVTEAMEDEELADLLQELPEEDQAEIIEGMETERAAHVLEEMEPDDAADLLAELDADDRGRLLAAMDPDEANPLRRLLRYDKDTAGGLMTPEPIILLGISTVADTPDEAGQPRPALRPRGLRSLLRSHRPHPRDRPLPRDPDRGRRAVDHLQRRRRHPEVRPLPVHPPQPGVLHPGRLRRPPHPPG